MPNQKREAHYTSKDSCIFVPLKFR